MTNITGQKGNKKTVASRLYQKYEKRFDWKIKDAKSHLSPNKINMQRRQTEYHAELQNFGSKKINVWHLR